MTGTANPRVPTTQHAITSRLTCMCPASVTYGRTVRATYAEFAISRAYTRVLAHARGSGLVLGDRFDRVVIPGIAEAPVLGAPVVEPHLLPHLRGAVHVGAALGALVHLLPPACAGAGDVLRHWTMIRAIMTIRTTSSVLFAEALGTFFLCFAGIAAILCTAPPIPPGAALVPVAPPHALAPPL